MAKTTNFGLNKFGQEGRISDEGYKFSLRDRETIDTLFYDLYNHDHTGASQTFFAGPEHRPTLTLNTTGGTLPAGVNLFYRYSYLDAVGNESAASVENVVTTASPIIPPDSPLLQTATTGGSLTPGTYKYALSYYQGSAQTRAPNISTISVPSGTVTNTVTITLPTIATDADGWKIYRKGPGDVEYWLLYTLAAGATPPTTWVDDGSQSPDCDKKRPTVNDTNATNSVTIDIAAEELPLDGNITAWRVYRTSVGGVYGSNSLLVTVTETTTQGGSDLVTTTTDVGGGLFTGRPLEQTTVPPNVPQLDASNAFDTTLGRLAGGLAPLSVHTKSSFILGTITNSTIYDQFVPAYDMPVDRVDVFLQDAPNADGSNYGTVRITDDASQNEFQYIWTDSTVIPELQSLYTAATSGTFTLSFDGQGPTGSLDWDATPAEIKTELELLSNINTVSVFGSGTALDPWYVRFDDPTGDVALLTYSGITLTIAEVTPGFDGGTFTLTFEGQTTAAIDFDATAGTVETALENLSTITAATVTGTGTEADPWVVEFVNPGAEDVEIMQGDATNLGGNSLVIGVQTEGYGNTTIDVDFQSTAQANSWVSSTTDYGVIEAEDASPGGGTQVSDATASADVAMELDAQNETCQWEIGTLDPGSYTARFWVRDIDLTSDFDIAVMQDMVTPSDILRTNISLHRPTYTPYYELKFTLTSAAYVWLEVKKTDTGSDRVRVDKFEYEINLPVLHAGATCTVEGVVTNSPTDAGGDGNVTIWY